MNHHLYFTIKFINTLSAFASDSDVSKITFDSNRLKNKYFLSICLTYQINYSNGHSIKVNPEQQLHLLTLFKSPSQVLFAYFYLNSRYLQISYKYNTPDVSVIWRFYSMFIHLTIIK